jgi:hypothetical protein
MMFAQQAVDLAIWSSDEVLNRVSPVHFFDGEPTQIRLAGSLAARCGSSSRLVRPASSDPATFRSTHLGWSRA